MQLMYTRVTNFTKQSAFLALKCADMTLCLASVFHVEFSITDSVVVKRKNTAISMILNYAQYSASVSSDFMALYK